jgi:hypothetical protein
LGVKEISRDDYLARVARASACQVDLSKLDVRVDV